MGCWVEWFFSVIEFLCDLMSFILCIYGFFLPSCQRGTRHRNVEMLPEDLWGPSLTQRSVISISVPSGIGASFNQVLLSVEELREVS